MTKSQKKAKSVQEVLNERKITTVEDMKSYLVGRKIRVTSNNDSNTYGIGSEHVLTEDLNLSSNGTGGYSISLMTPFGYMGNWMKLSNCTFTEDTAESLTSDAKSIDKMIAKLNDEKSSINEKLKFLEETKEEVVDLNKFINYKLEVVLSSKKPADVKAKEIMALFK